VATQFDTVFEQFLLIIDNPKLLTNLTDDCFAKTLSDFLNRSRGICKKYLYKNVNNCVLTKSFNQSFVGDGVTTQFNLTVEAIENAELYVSVDNIKLNNCIYNYDSNLVTLSATPTQDSAIYIGIYKTGYFNEDYDIDEITYLARGMTIPWLEFQLNKEKHLNQIVYGKDYNVNSQANHTSENRKTVDDTEARLLRDLNLYTYNSSPDSMIGLGG
jgi:hypothetical protein